MGFNSAFKGLTSNHPACSLDTTSTTLFPKLHVNERLCRHLPQLLFKFRNKRRHIQLILFALFPLFYNFHHTFFIPFFFWHHGLTTIVGEGLLIVEDSRSHSGTPHSVELLWTSDQPHSETST